MCHLGVPEKVRFRTLEFKTYGFVSYFEIGISDFRRVYPGGELQKKLGHLGSAQLDHHRCLFSRVQNPRIVLLAVFHDRADEELSPGTL